MKTEQEKWQEKLDKIRQRKSYKMFKDFAEFLDTLGVKLFPYQKEAILKRIYSELDNRNAYGSATNAMYAGESLNLLSREIKGESLEL